MSVPILNWTNWLLDVVCFNNKTSIISELWLEELIRRKIEREETFSYDLEQQQMLSLSPWASLLLASKEDVDSISFYLKLEAKKAEESKYPT